MLMRKILIVFLVEVFVVTGNIYGLALNPDIRGFSAEVFERECHGKAIEILVDDFKKIDVMSGDEKTRLAVLIDELKSRARGTDKILVIDQFIS
ncbi:hypothetical protein KKC59_00050, partial [bacterium]|nr:hypothetical protein [bacterium]